MEELKDLGKIIDEMVYKVTSGPNGQHTLWEKKMRLHIKPKPAWCPDKLWAKLVSLVVIQSEQKLKGL